MPVKRRLAAVDVPEPQVLELEEEETEPLEQIPEVPLAQGGASRSDSEESQTRIAEPPWAELLRELKGTKTVLEKDRVKHKAAENRQAAAMRGAQETLKRNREEDKEELRAAREEDREAMREAEERQRQAMREAEERQRQAREEDKEELREAREEDKRVQAKLLKSAKAALLKNKQDTRVALRRAEERQRNINREASTALMATARTFRSELEHQIQNYEARTQELVARVCGQEQQLSNLQEELRHERERVPSTAPPAPVEVATVPERPPSTAPLAPVVVATGPERVVAHLPRPVVKYDGTSDVTEFLVQFGFLAETHGWGERQQGQILASSLSGAALSCLCQIPEAERSSFESITTALNKRFSSSQQRELCRLQFKNRMQKREEQILELADDLKRLAKRAYPSVNSEMRDTLIQDQLVQALQDPELQIQLRLARCKTLDETISAAVEFQSTLSLAHRARPPIVRQIGLSGDSGKGSPEPASSLESAIASLAQDVKSILAESKRAGDQTRKKGEFGRGQYHGVPGEYGRDQSHGAQGGYGRGQYQRSEPENDYRYSAPPGQRGGGQSGYGRDYYQQGGRGWYQPRDGDSNRSWGGQWYSGGRRTPNPQPERELEPPVDQPKNEVASVSRGQRQTGPKSEGGPQPK